MLRVCLLVVACNQIKEDFNNNYSLGTCASFTSFLIFCSLEKLQVTAFTNEVTNTTSSLACDRFEEAKYFSLTMVV